MMKFKVAAITLLVSAIAFGCTQQQASNPDIIETSPPPSQPREGNGNERGNTSNTSVFRTVDHPTRGQMRLTEANGKRYLEFSDDFRTDSGPDLYVVLHRDREVSKGIQERDYVSLARLQQINGSQRYEIPNDLNLSDYQSVAIWCRQFNVTFGYAPLSI